jgi:hypothetical protein
MHHQDGTVIFFKKRPIGLLPLCRLERSRPAADASRACR